MLDLNGLKVFGSEHTNGTKSLVICNYKWYRPYYWHIPQLDARLYDGPITVINIAELSDEDGNKLPIRRTLFTLKTLISEADRIIVDGFVGLGFYLVISLGFLKNKTIILGQQNLTAPNTTLRSKLKYLFIKTVYSNVDTILVNVETQKLFFESYFGDEIGAKCKVYCPPINFEGVKDFLQPSKSVGSFVLSAGQANRDYNLLAASLKDFSSPFTLYCPSDLYNAYDFPSHVDHQDNLDTSGLLSLIRRCRFLVIPLKDTMEMSGLRVLTFGLELGKTIVVTKTKPLIEVFSDDPPFIYCPQDNPAALTKIMEDLNGDEERIRVVGESARLWAEKNLLSSDFVNNIWKDVILKPK